MHKPTTTKQVKRVACQSGKIELEKTNFYCSVFVALTIAIENNRYDVVDELLRQKELKVPDESVKTLIDLANQQSNYSKKKKKKKQLKP